MNAWNEFWDGIRVSTDFPGGNLVVKRADENTLWVTTDVRDSSEWWFYWCFSVETKRDCTVRFVFGDWCLGYYGPAISRDFKTWRWYADAFSGNEFEYTFRAGETVYFAHDMVYSVEMWRDFLRKNALPWRTFCLSNKGREVPCLELGEGAQTVLLTSRHHACESTGTYVLQGVVEHWLKNPILGYRLMCVPFMDMDGVMEGDQGKARKPHDHNRDYNRGENTLYNEVRAIERYVDTHTVPCLFDFHSSWHISGDNDHVFFVGHSHCAREIDRLSALLEASLTSNALQYRTAYNFPANTG